MSFKENKTIKKLVFFFGLMVDIFNIQIHEKENNEFQERSMIPALEIFSKVTDLLIMDPEITLLDLFSNATETLLSKYESTGRSKLEMVIQLLSDELHGVKINKETLKENFGPVDPNSFFVYHYIIDELHINENIKFYKFVEKYFQDFIDELDDPSEDCREDILIEATQEENIWDL